MSPQSFPQGPHRRVHRRMLLLCDHVLVQLQALNACLWLVLTVLLQGYDSVMQWHHCQLQLQIPLGWCCLWLAQPAWQCLGPEGS
jgi:hypothetical protein